jgi:hypothetical protein
MSRWINETMIQWISASVKRWLSEPVHRWMTDWVNRCINESVNQWITDSGSVNYIYIHTYIFPDLHDHHDPSWCWEYMYICMWQLWWTRVADFAAVLAVKPCVLCPFIGWSLGILIISYTAIVPAYPKHSTSNAFLELVYNCQHTLLFFQLLSYLLVHLCPLLVVRLPETINRTCSSDRPPTGLQTTSAILIPSPLKWWILNQLDSFVYPFWSMFHDSNLGTPSFATEFPSFHDGFFKLLNRASTKLVHKYSYA